MAQLDGLLGSLSGRRILVIGDIMLDHFVVGRVDRISPEAPVPVVLFERDEFRLGGAANVATNIRALGGEVDLAGVIGSDTEATRTADELERLSIGTAGVLRDGSRPTTRKLRIVTTRRQQVARVDYERDVEVSGTIEAHLIRCLDELAGAADALVISDYLKGVVSSGVAAAAVRAARARRVPLLIDPKVPHIDYYAGATLVTPNHHEAEAVSHMRIRSAAEARDAARRFRDRARCDSVLITRGEHGMWLLGAGDEVDLPAEARDVADVTGAGDTVVAALALGLAAGGSLLDAARLANRAAGIAVSRFGPATVTVDDLRAG